MKTLRTRLTFANVTSCLALFVALGGFAVAAGLAQELQSGANSSRRTR